jgi:hypothetical protein
MSADTRVKSREPTGETIDKRERLRPGNLVSNFDGVTHDGREVPYEELWQRRNFVLFVVPAELGATASSYFSALERRLADLKPADTSLVLSHQPINGVGMNGLVIADRWSEVVHAADLASDPASWPSIDDIVEWVEFIRSKCEECPPL